MPVQSAGSSSVLDQKISALRPQSGPQASACRNPGTMMANLSGWVSQPTVYGIGMPYQSTPLGAQLAARQMRQSRFERRLKRYALDSVKSLVKSVPRVMENQQKQYWRSELLLHTLLSSMLRRNNQPSFLHSVPFLRGLQSLERWLGKVPVRWEKKRKKCCKVQERTIL